MRHSDAATTAQVGVDRVSLTVREELGWLFRGQSIDDYGIDAQVEIVEAGEVVPRLLALQIKSGASFFLDPSPDGGWWFRPKAEHVRYWTNHVLPVVVVLVNPETKRCHWQAITPESLERSSRGGWKVRIPEAQVIDESARVPWRTLAEGDPSVARMRELRLAAPWSVASRAHAVSQEQRNKDYFREHESEILDALGRISEKVLGQGFW